MRTQYLVIFIISIVLDIGSLSKYGIDFQYIGYHEIAKQAEAFRETDCLLYYGDGWLDIYTGFPNYGMIYRYEYLQEWWIE